LIRSGFDRFLFAMVWQMRGLPFAPGVESPTPVG
jgi:hypothetical protein